MANKNVIKVNNNPETNIRRRRFHINWLLLINVGENINKKNKINYTNIWAVDKLANTHKYAQKTYRE